MTSARDRREELEAVCWRNSIPASVVAEILAAADAYARASRPRDPEKPAEPRKPPAIHWGRPGAPHPACRPFDGHAANNWLVAADLEAVTCGHCLRIFARREAAAS